jgi:argininosuccinate lyase
VGRAVRLCVESDRELAELSLDELQTFSPHIEADVFQVLTVEGSVAARDHLGGTAPAQVRKAVARARRQLQQATG